MHLQNTKRATQGCSIKGPSLILSTWPVGLGSACGEVSGADACLCEDLLCRLNGFFSNDLLHSRIAADAAVFNDGVPIFGSQLHELTIN